ncbi:hypothetical protein [Pelagicoccus sp. SDUM812002]|uniref:hypothetical protein n=1 Tax=Pelagicoccus sp. SDUM812002 TaxID=3041266 RepID=UPI00280F547E|nr:hypothetical protein [Pelagicoccus sp. SDUM812002]MDQ8187123.1 hypothetical protein [Pelagicoccus sp. SDUM812002]
MKTKLALAALVLSSFLATSPAVARSHPSTEKSFEGFLARMDLNQDHLVNEAELKVALQALEDRLWERVSRVEEGDAAEAMVLRARLESNGEDPMLGTPDLAATFIMANFDADGNWELDLEELGQAFSTLRKWRSEGQS